MSKHRIRIGWWASLAAALVVCAAIPASAQERGQGRGRGFGFGGMNKVTLVTRSEQVQKELKLAEDQMQKIEQISEDMRAEMRELGGFSNENREKMAKLSADAEKKVVEVLNAEQNGRLSQIVRQLNGPSTLAQDEEAAKALKLSDEQKQKIASAVEERTNKMRELFGRQRDGQDGGDAFAAMREIRTKTDEQIVAVLSAEQKQQWEGLKGKPFELDRSQFRGGFGGGRRPGGNQ